MAVQPKFSYVEETYERVIPPSNDLRSSKRGLKEYRFSFAQVLVSWAVIAGMMVAIFLFGLFAGREQGVRQALNERGQLDKRVAVATAAAPTVKKEAVKEKAPEVTAKEVKTPKKPAVEKVVETKAKKPKVKPQQKPEAVTPAIKVSDKITSGFYVQMAARKSLEGAQKLISGLGQVSFPLIIEKARVGGADYYRILVGPYKNVADANKAQKSVQKLDTGLGKPFVKRVK